MVHPVQVIDSSWSQLDSLTTVTKHQWWFGSMFCRCCIWETIQTIVHRMVHEGVMTLQTAVVVVQQGALILLEFPRDIQGLLSMTRDGWGSLGIAGDSWRWLEIPRNG